MLKYLYLIRNGEKMVSLILCVAFLVLFIIQIIMFINFVKKKEKRYWIISFCLEAFSIIMALGLLYYYEFLALRNGFMPGLKYLGEELTCMGASFLCFIMLCVTTISGIIIFEKNRKKKSESQQAL